MEDISKYRNQFDNAIVALGNNHIRSKYHEILEQCGYHMPVLVHPTAYVSLNAKLAFGYVIRTFVVAGRYTELGKATILNIGTKVDHQCINRRL